MADTITDTIIAYAKNYTRQETGMIMGGEHLSLDQALAEIKRIIEEAKPEKTKPTMDDFDMFGDLDHSIRARNGAINEYHRNLLKALGE